jgi:uncharacterized protein
MNVEVAPDRVRPAPLASKPAVADCDIHPTIRSFAEILPYLEPRWRDHIKTYGLTRRTQYANGAPAYPKGQPLAMRRDAWAPDGAKPGSDLDFMRAQHLDANNVALGILNPLSPSGQGMRNPDLAAALCRAANDWQVETLTSRDDRLKASIVVPYEDGAASVAEIERCAPNPDFVQVLLLSRTNEPIGQRRYWPIYEAASRAGRPVAIHAFGYGGSPFSASGWPSYYIEEVVGHAQCCQSGLVSLVVEGAFARIPGLRVILVESGFAWLPSLAWRLDRVWRRLRDETPHLARLPSEYIRDHVWLTTQPMEEPEQREQLIDIIDWIGWDRVLFATDYPHWDFDDPAYALPLRISDQQRRGFFLENARAVYGIAG